MSIRPNSSSTQNIDIAAIKRKVGDSVFAQGKALFETLNDTHDIKLLSQSDNKVIAALNDGQFYIVELDNLYSLIEGKCSCPVSENFDFCAHCVALSLYLFEQDKAQIASRQGSPNQRIEARLQSLTQSDLKTALMSLISGDTHLQNKWLALADINNQKIDKAHLNKMIVRALPLKNLRQQDKVKAYFSAAETKINELLEIFKLLPAEPAFKMAESFLWRYDTIMMNLEDTNKQRVASLNSLKEHFCACFKKLEWEASQKALYLFNLNFAEFVHIDFEDIPKAFINDEPEVNKQYHRLLLAYLSEQGLQKSKATNAISPLQRRMLQSLADYSTKTGDMKKAAYYRGLIQK